MTANLAPFRRHWLLATCCAIMSLAPTPGDIGACGQEPVLLDAELFASAKTDTECEACGRCSLASQRCEEACAGPPPGADFPVGCLPLVHDGEVCLRALEHSSCEDYTHYMDDLLPEQPTECDFCPGSER